MQLYSTLVRNEIDKQKTNTTFKDRTHNLKIIRQTHYLLHKDSSSHELVGVSTD